MYAISSYRGNRATYTQNTHTNRTDYNTLCCSVLCVQCALVCSVSISYNSVHTISRNPDGTKPLSCIKSLTWDKNSNWRAQPTLAIISDRKMATVKQQMFSDSTHYRSFRRRVFPVNYLYRYWQPNKNNQETEHTNNTNNTTQKSALAKSTRHTQKKSMLRERTDRAWFSRLLQHPARKQSRSMVSPRSPQGTRVPEPAWG